MKTIQTVKFLRALKKGSKIFITAPSGGEDPKIHDCLNLSIEQIQRLSFQVLEGNCLRSESKHVSAIRGNSLKYLF